MSPTLPQSTLFVRTCNQAQQYPQQSHQIKIHGVFTLEKQSTPKVQLEEVQLDNGLEEVELDYVLEEVPKEVQIEDLQLK